MTSAYDTVKHMAKAVFLDRDGTLNPDPGYISDPEDFSIYPWVAGDLKLLKDAGYLLILISNQSGIGRGLIDPKQLKQIHKKLNRLLDEQAGVEIDLIQICPHHPEDECECRKPKPKLIFDAAEKLNLRLHQSFLIGDRQTDYEAGQSAKLKQSFLIPAGNELAFRNAVSQILRS